MMMLSRVFVAAVTVALTPATIMISLAVEYLAPDPFDQPGVADVIARSFGSCFAVHHAADEDHRAVGEDECYCGLATTGLGRHGYHDPRDCSLT